MMANTRKRMMALFMAFVMCFSLLPISALAEGENTVEVFVGETTRLPNSTASDAGDEWSVENETIASVQDGEVTGLAIGTTVVTHTYYVEKQSGGSASSAPTEEPAAPAEEPAAPAEEPSAPTEEPAAPAEEPAAPTEEPSAPTEEPAAPAEEPAAPAEEPSAPAEEPAAPAEESSTPAASTFVGSGMLSGVLVFNDPTEEPSAPAEEPAAPTEEPSAPTEEPSAPTEEPAAPTEEPSAPTEEPSAPAEEPSAPAEEPAAPAEEPSAPAEEPSSGSVEYVARTETWKVIVKEKEPMLTGSAEYDGTKVDVSVPEGAFDEMPKLVILPVVPQEEKEKNVLEEVVEEIGAFLTGSETPEVAEASLEDVSGLLTEQMDNVTEETPVVAFDITFYQIDENGDYVLDENGKPVELQPALPIDVEFSMEDSDLMDDAENAELQVYHVDSKVTDATTVETDVVDDTTAKVAADTFSIYAITVTKPNGTTYTIAPDGTVTLTGTAGYAASMGHSWSSSKTSVATVSTSSTNVTTVTGVGVGSATITHKYYSSDYRYKTEYFTINVVKNALYIDTSTIMTKGSLTAKLASGIDTTDATYAWSVSSSVSGTYTPVEDYDPGTALENYSAFAPYTDAQGNVEANTLFVARAGAQKWFRVTVTLKDGTKYTSNAEQVSYYDTLQNGGFESPVVKDGAYSQYKNSHFLQIPSGTEGLFWQTSANGPKWGNNSAGYDFYVEIADGSNTNYGTDSTPNINSSSTVYGISGATQKKQFAELNCQVDGALYQDVLTEPGSTLYWGLEHAGRQGNDTMAVIISDTKDLASGWNPASSNYNSRPDDVQAVITDAPGSWNYRDYKNSDNLRNTNGYVVPAGQYVTRFYFVAVSAAGGAADGNLLDNISFGRSMPTPPAGKGTLTVTKQITGLGMDANLSGYSVKVSIAGPESRESTITNFQYNPVTKNWVGTAPFSELTVGEYSVSEEVSSAPNYYSYDANGSTKTADVTVVEGENASAALINHYTMNGGMYTVSKLWTGETEDAERPDSISVQLYDKDNHTVGDAVTLNGANLWTYTWHGLDEDGTYYARETVVPDGYVESPHDNASISVGAFKKYTPNSSLTIPVSATSAIVAKRTGQSPNIVWTAAPMTPAQQTKFISAFNAENPSMKLDAAADSFISGLSVNVDGISFSAEGVTFSATSQWAMVASGAYTPAGTVITNAYQPNETYTFTKTWAGNAAGAHTSINVTISGNGETYTGTVTKDGGTLTGGVTANVSVNGNIWTITASLPKAANGYTIAENKVNTLTVTGGVAQNGDSGEWRVTGNSTTALTNTYWAYAKSTTSDTVTLTISKTDAESSAKLSGAKFQVYEGNGTSGAKVGISATTDAQGKATITLGAKDLKDGTYTLYEEETPSAVYPTHESKTFTVNASSEVGAPTENSSTHVITTNTHYSAAITGLTGSNGSYAVSVTNRHAKGTLSIEKHYYIDDAAKIPETTNVSYGDGQSVTFAKEDFTYNTTGGYYSASENVGNLNTGDYTISETRPVIDGYTGKTQIADGALSSDQTVNQVVTLTTGTNTVVVENRNARTTHSLTVAKNVTWDGSKSQAPAAKDTFDLMVIIGTGSTRVTKVSGTSVNNNGALNATYSFTVNGQRNGTTPTEGFGAVTVTGVPYGAWYTVRETGIHSDNRTGYATALPAEQNGWMGTENAAVMVINRYFKSQMAEEISVTKDWKEWNETTKTAATTTKRADSITVGVYVGNNLVAGTERTLTATDNWTTSYNTLPKYDNTNAHNAIPYTVKETAINGQRFDSNGRVVVYGDATVSGSNQQEVEGYWTTLVDGSKITNTYYAAEDISDTAFKVLKVSSADNATTLAGVVFTLRSNAIANAAKEMEATTDANGIATFQNLMPGDYTLVEKSTISGYEKNDTEWSFTVSDKNGTLTDVKSPEATNGNLFQNFWNWMVSAVTGTVKSYDVATKTATVENTPIVTGLTKQVYADAYTADSFVESDYAASKWSESASWTNLPANTATVKALFRVTVTGTVGAAYNVGDTMTIDGKNAATLVSGSAEGKIGTSGSVVLYYTATIPVTTTETAYTNTAANRGVDDATAVVTVAKNDFVSGSFTIAKTWNHGNGDLANSAENKANLDSVTFQVQRKTETASDWENVTLTGANLAAGTNNASVDSGLLVLTTTDGANASATLADLLMEQESDLAEYTYRVVETKIANTSITDGKALGYTNDGPQTVVGGAATIVNTYAPAKTDVEGATTFFTVNKTDGTNAITSAPAQFTLTSADGTVSKWTTANGEQSGTVTGSTTFDGLKVGTYTLTETAAPAGYARSSSSWQIVVTPSEVYTHNADGTVTVTTNYVIADGAITGSAANDYQITNTVDAKAITVYNTRQTGELTITKTLSGEERANAASRTFGFTVTAPTVLNGTYGAAHFTNSATSNLITVTGEGSVTLNNLPTSAGYADRAYTVSELYEITNGDGIVAGGAHINGYALSVYSVDSQPIANTNGHYTQSVTVGTTANAVTFRNDYQLDAAQNEARFTIVKKSSDVTTDANKALGGAIFGVYSDKDCKNLILTTPATDITSGVTTVVLDTEKLGNTGSNTFYLKELTAPTGYTADETVWKISVDKNNATGAADVELIQPNTGLFHDLYHWFVGLVKGDDTAEQNWTADTGIGEDRTYGTLTVYNAPITTPDYTTETETDDVTLQIRKTDSLTGETITHSNATFTLTRQGTTPITATTVNGVASHTFAHSDDGIYAITETAAPDGYVLRTDVLGYVKVATVRDHDAWNADHTTLVQYYKTTAAIYGANDPTCVGSAIVLTEGALEVVNQPKTILQVTKTWTDVNGNPIAAPADASVTFELYRKAAGDAAFSATGEKIVLNGDVTDNSTQEVEKWVAQWKNLDPEYTYTAKEVKGFTDYTATAQDGWMEKNAMDSTETMTVGTITNQRDYGTLHIVKHVSGLQKNEEKTYHFTVTDTENTDKTYHYQATVAGNTSADGVLASGLVADGELRLPTGTYTVTEESANISNYSLHTTVSYPVEGAQSVNVGTGIATVSVSNDYQYNPAFNTENVTITKAWNDSSNADGIRPTSITVELRDNSGKLIGQKEISASGETGTATFEFDTYLNGYAAPYTGKEIGYTDANGYHAAAEVPGYTSSGIAAAGNGYTITNTHTAETVSVQVEKQWPDGRSQEVLLTLMANGRRVAGVTLDGVVDETETQAWKASFGEFGKNSNGAPIDYTVSEADLGNNWSYQVTKSTVESGYSFTVINRYTYNNTDDDDDDDDPSIIIPDTDTPTTDIPDENVPTTDIPDENVPTTDIPDEEVPLNEFADPTKTGDTLVIWILAAAVSGLSLVWLAISGKKRKDDNAR